MKVMNKIRKLKAEKRLFKDTHLSTLISSRKC